MATQKNTLLTRFEGDDTDFNRTADRVEKRGTKAGNNIQKAFSARALAGGTIVTAAAAGLAKLTKDILSASEAMGTLGGMVKETYSDLTRFAASGIDRAFGLGDMGMGVTDEELARNRSAWLTRRRRAREEEEARRKALAESSARDFAAFERQAEIDLFNAGGSTIDNTWQQNYGRSTRGERRGGPGAGVPMFGAQIGMSVVDRLLRNVADKDEAKRTREAIEEQLEIMRQSLETR